MPNGVFWTIPISPNAVTYNLKKGTARYRLKDLPLRDFHNLGGGLLALSPGTDRAFATFDLNWSGPIARFHQRDTANRFVGDYIETAAAISFSTTQSGFSFKSNPPPDSHQVFAAIGTERNGVYFS